MGGITFDEAAAFTSNVIVIYAILLMTGRYGGIRRTLSELRAALRSRDWKAWQLILVGLLVPQTMQLLYFGLLLLPLPDFESNLALRQAITRSYTIFSNLILSIYFLNGKLVEWLDALYRLWKQHFPTSSA